MLNSLKQDFQKVCANFVFMFIVLGSLETYRSVVLAGIGDRHFLHGYLYAFTTALIMAKSVVLADKLPLPYTVRSLLPALRVLAGACALTVLAALLRKVEDWLLHGSGERSAVPMLLTLSHYMVLGIIFSLFLAVRTLDRHLGTGTLLRFFFNR